MVPGLMLKSFVKVSWCLLHHLQAAKSCIFSDLINQDKLLCSLLCIKAGNLPFYSYL